jgi:hypothetical protein
MTKVMVSPGPCGFKTAIAVAKTAKRKVKVIITSDCETVTNLGQALSVIDYWDSLQPRESSDVHTQAAARGLHTACPVPIAILKAIEVEAGIAVPRDVSIRFEKTRPAERQ